MSDSLLSNFVRETSFVRLGQELLNYLDIDSSDSSSSDSSDSSSSSSTQEDYYEEDEQQFVRRILNIFSQLDSLPVEISRPYRVPGLTDAHSNSVTVLNFDSKFPEARVVLRFEKQDILLLTTVLKFPETLLCSGYRIPAFEALVVFLRRLAYPGRYVDFMVELDRSIQTLAFIFNTVAVLIFRNFGDKVRSLEHDLFLKRENLEIYARAIFAKGCPYDNCSHFGDGTCIQVCRPSVYQERFYCGHHGYHCFKVLLFELPNGIAFAFGPFSGSGHDSSAAQRMELDEYLRIKLTYPDVQFTGMYDLGFSASDVMSTPGRRARARDDPELAAFNRDFSRIRICNEQGIGKIKTLFAFLSYHKNLKVLMSPVGVYFFDAVFLTNIHSILYGSQVASYFNLPVPTLEEYLE